MKQVRTGLATMLGTLAAAPLAAYAEESSAGAEILIPKPAEFIPALIVFLIIWFLLAKFAWPKVLHMLEERERTIQESMDEAEEIKAQAGTARDEANQTVADARRQASEILLAARSDSEKERARIVADAHKEAEEIIIKAREYAADEQRRIYANATDTIAKLSVSVARKVIGEELSADTEKQRELIKKYVAEVGNLQ
ncbi:F0F1 ATP synthase subunit B [Collinsella sp. zg1085]|uniref:F0F1 ATP synthase subunit B n=1 Tax=Collinsella sp. zg1085 TaxID=2844380 RepID=UPI001C0C1E62|nr:F0F1 ATP synthase subunit B [Collinsella sp. zg1085]QWT17726.1 F0F1 ATP synthase subunit B [Collinsella sp. zg1085]